VPTPEADDRSCRSQGLAPAPTVGGAPSTSVERFAPAIILTKREAFEVCEAIADSERLLLRSGNVSQAARLAALFELVEGRLAVDGHLTAIAAGAAGHGVVPAR
jgi:hypothetical protein